MKVNSILDLSPSSLGQTTKTSFGTRKAITALAHGSPRRRRLASLNLAGSPFTVVLNMEERNTNCQDLVRSPLLLLWDLIQHTRLSAIPYLALDATPLPKCLAPVLLVAICFIILHHRGPRRLIWTCLSHEQQVR